MIMGLKSLLQHFIIDAGLQALSPLLRNSVPLSRREKIGMRGHVRPLSELNPGPPRRLLYGFPCGNALCRIFRGSLGGEPDPKRASFSRATDHVDMGFMVLDDSVDDGQPQPSA